MSVYSVIGAISRAMPEGRFKAALRNAFYHTIYILPIGTKKARIGKHEFMLKRTLFGAESPEDFKEYPKLAPIRKDAIVIDVGAFFGTFTIYAALTAREGHVIAIEPEKAHARIIGDNLRINTGLGPISVVHAGLSDRSGTARLASGGSSTTITPGGNDVRMFTGDGLVKKLQLPRVDLIKMNIEGAELQAVPGFRKTIARWHPTLIISADHVVQGEPTWKTLVPMLTRWGYTVRRHRKDLLIAEQSRSQRPSRTVPT